MPVVVLQCLSGYHKIVITYGHLRYGWQGNVSLATGN